MRRPGRPRETVSLSKTVQHQLNMYALAAGAAGVAALYSVQAAQAEIIYTPAHAKIPRNGVLFFDLNHDGVADFGLRSRVSYASGIPAATLRVIPQRKANEIWAVSTFKGVDAAALPKSMKVQAGRDFQRGGSRYYDNLGLLMDEVATSSYGPWSREKEAYLGLRFVVEGSIHYGWARVRINSQSRQGISAILTGYAYETIPGKPIITGATKGPDVVIEPATLGHLAAGASGR